VISIYSYLQDYLLLELGMLDDGTAQERRRLSAAWLNIVAAGVVSAGVMTPLAAVAVSGWGERTAYALAVGGASLLIGCGLHLLARAVLREK
jgi:hypothetical protein